jgi:hypothetical protein
VGWYGLDWSGSWKGPLEGFVNTVMNLRVTYNAGIIYWVAAQLAASQERLSSMTEWVRIVNIAFNFQIILEPATNRIRIITYGIVIEDRLCGLVVRVPGYRSREPELDSRRYQIFWDVVGLERGPLNLVRIIEELLEWKSKGLRV